MLDRIEHVANLWNLQLLDDKITTVTGVLAFAIVDSQPVALKIAADLVDEEQTAAVLTHYDGLGAVKVLKHEGKVTLMERAIPGTHLSQLVAVGEDVKATEIVCDVISKLHQHREFKGEYKTIADLAKGFDRYIKSGDTQVPLSLLDKGKYVYGELLKTQGEPELLHGDLHHDNILLY